ncbi:MAG TPA: molybdopterin-guanine dinucleotide biosynthesis protein B [Planctomycetaceae bacterium]|nr:molybdopterin-guanine dinucleotide biosynthesis protein B [Planctomycetaceae bacterium]HIQ22454.1 molybdopterin-guanine dinucleotide biosynthesis protein B [Planctomycetota bacterium]
MMKRVHIVGRKNHGKTRLIVELIEELARRGIRVGVVKHSAHRHELDRPGKDSYRQRKAGADPVAVVTAELIGIYLGREAGEDFYRKLAPLFGHCQLVLVEGHIDAEGPKVEVWRHGRGDPPLAAMRSDIAAVVSDDRPEVTVPVWPRSQLAFVAEQLWGLVDAP